jgi:hypothetical protein
LNSRINAIMLLYSPFDSADCGCESSVLHHSTGSFTMLGAAVMFATLFVTGIWFGRGSSRLLLVAGVGSAQLTPVKM